jgi:hypothetical protein
LISALSGLPLGQVHLRAIAAATLGSTADADVVMDADGRTDVVLRFITSTDYDGDTVPDIIVGSPSGGTDHEGMVYFVSGVGF